MLSLLFAAPALAFLAGGDDPKPAAPQTPAADTTLVAGRPAPALTIEKWVKGSPVPAFEKGKVYVIEFWATWCKPCIASMPHITALQNEYRDKGLTIIGLTSADERNSLAQVEAMVKEKGDGMGYTVAWDKERTTNEAFMLAAKQNGIPCSFLIDKTGTVAYIGHPMTLDEPLARVVDGTWDIVKGNEEMKAVEKDMPAIRNLTQTNPKRALKLMDELEKKYPRAFARNAAMKVTVLLAAKENDRAMKLLAPAIDEAIAHKDFMALNEIAWTLVDPKGSVANPDLDQAMRAAAKAVELTENKDGAILDTLARVYFRKGDIDKALELQRKAVELAVPEMKADIQASLTEFEQAKAARAK